MKDLVLTGKLMKNTMEQNQKQSLSSSQVLKPVSFTEDILSVLKLFKRYWVLFAIFSFIGLMVGFAYARYSRDYYECTTLLQLNARSKSGKAIAEIGDVFETHSPALAEIHLIKSLSVMKPVVEMLHLNYTAEPTSVLDRFLQREGRMDLDLFEPPKTLMAKNRQWIAKVVSADSFELFSPMGDSLVTGLVGQTYRLPVGDDSVAICVRSMQALPGQKFVLKKAPALKVAKSLRNAVNASEKDKNTNVMEISYMDRYPDRAAKVVNAVAEMYVRQNVEMRSAEAEKSLEFLEEQLPSIKAKLRSAQHILTSYRNRAGTVDLGAEAQGTLKRQVELKTQMLSLQQEIQEKSRLFKQDHPAMLALLHQQERLINEINQEEGKTKKLPTTQQDVLKLQQEVEINNQLYTSVLNNIQQLRVVRASEIGNVRIVDLADVDDVPAKPNRKKIVLMGFGIGFGLCWILVLFLHRLRNRGVGASSEIERETGVSVYAKVPKTRINRKLPGAEDRRFVLAKIDSEDIAVEKIRTLRTALEFSCIDAGGRVLMVTGIAPEAGKSFIALNLAYLFAKQDKRVLFIDADLRRSRLSHKFEKGVSDILANACKLEDVVVDMGDGAYFLPNGSHVSNPGEMLASKAFADLIQDCRQKFDIVVVDTPPNSMVSDALSIAKLVDFGLIVIEYKKHSMENIQEVIDQLNMANLDKVAIVLNQCVRENSSYGYGYGNRYRYGES